MRRFLVFLLGLAILLAGAAAWAVWNVRATLPKSDETARVDARGTLAAGTTVTLEYDGRGVPTIKAQDELSLAFGQGWAHARDRRFQMELYRRAALGRLSEWVGSGTLPSDRQFRALGLAQVADSALGHLAPARRARFDAYAAGVNAWDAGHRKAPEFLVLGVSPAPWSARDVILTGMLMLQDLTWDQADEEQTTEAMDAALPPSVVAFLRPGATAWDAPLDDAPAPPAPPTPTAQEFDVRARKAALAPSGKAVVLDRLALGSNNWAIAGSRTASGRALVAGDPHLALRVPVIWHRQRLVAPGFTATGITLPGVPGVVFGTNGKVAWSGTNVEADFVDLVRCVPLADDSTRYEGPAGPEPFALRREVIEVRGLRADTVVVRTTRYGPVIARSAQGGWLAAQWIALVPAMYDTDLFGIDQATDVASFREALKGYGGPPLNFVFGDTSGAVGWAIGGRLPRRAGDPGRPRDSFRADAAWTGFVPADSMPAVLAPARGFVMTANQRTVGGAAWARLSGMPAAPWRARRIAQVLGSHAGWTAAECAALQNDVDDAFLQPTADALERALADVGSDTTLAAVKRILGTWTHRADTTSVAHAYLRYARGELARLLVEPLIAPCLERDSSFVYDWTLSDEVVRRLLAERPPHLLDPRYADYDELVRDAACSAARLLTERAPGVPLEQIVWGRINRADIAHPLAGAVPPLGKWLSMPKAALAGGSNVVRVARPRAGASMRMVVDLADPARSTWAFPGGQSGHFLSPYYADEFAGWVNGTTTGFEPGPTRGTVKLTVQ